MLNMKNMKEENDINTMLIPNEGQLKSCPLFFCGCAGIATFTHHHKKFLLMRKLLLTAAIAAILFSCTNTNPAADSPKGVVNAFIESSRQGDIDGIRKYITEQDAKLLDMGMQFLNMLDSGQQKKMKEQMAEKFKEHTKDVKIDIGNEKIDGDNATVEVSTTKEGKTETQPFALKKENGQWKISLISTGMKSSGMTQQEMDTEAKKMENDLRGAGDSLSKKLQQLRKINPDSLKKILNKGMEEAEKLQEAVEKAAQ